MSKILTGYASIEEAPEADRKFLQVEDGKVLYVNDGLLATLEAQRKAEREAKAEADKVKAQLDEMKRLADQEAQNKNKIEPKPNAEMEELKKSIEVLKAERVREQQENQRLKMEQTKIQAAEKAGLRPECLPIFDSAIGHDEKGVFVRDADGTPRIDPVTGQRMTLESFYAAETKSKPWAAKEAGAGSGFTGSAGYQQRAQVSATEIQTMKKAMREAILKGDAKAVQLLETQALQKGINL